MNSKGLHPGGLALIIGGRFCGKIVTLVKPISPSEEFMVGDMACRCHPDADPLGGWLVEAPGLASFNECTQEYDEGWTLKKTSHLMPLDKGDPDVDSSWDSDKLERYVKLVKSGSYQRTTPTKDKQL